MDSASEAKRISRRYSHGMLQTSINGLFATQLHGQTELIGTAVDPVSLN